MYFVDTCDTSDEQVGRALLQRWITEAQERGAISSSDEETENNEENYVSSGSSDVGERDQVTEINEPQVVYNEKVEERSGGGGGPFAFLKNFIPDNDKLILDHSTGDNYFRMLSGESNRDGYASGEIDGEFYTRNLGGDDDCDNDEYDDTIPTITEKYDYIINQLGRAMSAKFVPGIHRYSILYF